MIERMLNTGKRLGRIIILIVNVQIIMLHGITNIFRQQEVVNKRLCCFRCKFHHHTRRSIGIHVGILACNFIVLNVHNLHEHVTGLCLTCYRTLVTILNILLCNILASTLHELNLHGILNVLNTHLRLTLLSYMVGDATDKSFVLAFFGVHHGLSNGCLYFQIVKTDYSSVTFYYCLNHKCLMIKVDY